MEAASNRTSPTRETGEFWQHHDKLQKNSGLSRSAYCRKHDLNYYRFSHWVKKSRRVSAASKLVSVKVKPATEQTIQKPLCTLELSGGRCLKVYDTQALSFILERMG